MSFYRYTKIATLLFAAGVTVLSSASAMAGVVITGTRVIYPADKKEVTVKVNNAGKKPVLVQSWIDNGDTSAKPEKISTPFVLTPPINRIDPGKGQTLRLSYVGTSLPTNKESVFWLNVLEIPPKTAGTAEHNHLNIAFRNRIKIFYRPTGLPGDASAAPSETQWQAIAGGVRGSNNSPYYVSLVDVTYRVGGKEYKSDGKLIAPGAYTDFKFSGINTITSGSKVVFRAVNDHGAVKEFTSTVK